MHRVELNGEILQARDGELLSALLIRYGKSFSHPCGGKGNCKKCAVKVNGDEVFSCQYRICSDITLMLPDEDSIDSVIDAIESKTLTEHICFALDVGTTTLALALISKDERRIIRVITDVNPQRIFGSDVISRIGYCKQNGVFALQQSVVERINRMISTFSCPTVPTMYVAGNTTMLHLLLGVDCSSIGTAPYTPAFLESRRVAAEKIGIVGVDTVVTLPSFSSFVGADLVAGVNMIDFPTHGKYSLLVDLGTNAEVVLFSERKLLCTAAAAGPCFEGANISCGMSATKGAVKAVSLDQNKKIRIDTIQNASPRGLCGTGLIDTVAVLLQLGLLDETGRLENGCFQLTDSVTITQADIRQFQLAKAAVHASVLTLMRRLQIDFNQIETLYLSGGFSTHIDLKNAAMTGLLPTELTDRCVALNNSSLLGTVKYTYEENNLLQYTKIAEYVDLSADPYFSENFFEQMIFENFD